MLKRTREVTTILHSTYKVIVIRSLPLFFRQDHLVFIIIPISHNKLMP